MFAYHIWKYDFLLYSSYHPQNFSFDLVPDESFASNTTTVATVVNSTTSIEASETYFDRNHATVVTDYCTTTNARPPETSFARNLTTFAINATTTTSEGGMKI